MNAIRDYARAGLWVACLALIAAGLPDGPYDEGADASTSLQRGLTRAHLTQKDVLVIFGANWCPDCRALDKVMHSGDFKLIDDHFVTVKIDVGNFDRNLDIAARYGNPVSRGIPAAAILNPNGELLYATMKGELADARHMSAQDIYEFFSRRTERNGR